MEENSEKCLIDMQILNSQLLKHKNQSKSIKSYKKSSKLLDFLYTINDLTLSFMSILKFNK